MLRIIDANLNRLSEGLRVLEDITRFILNDPNLSEKLKTLRHDIIPQDPQLQEKLLNARQANEDVGAFIDTNDEGTRANPVELVNANAHRVQQSLRVLEEIAKLPDQDFTLDWEKLQHARFSIYELEQTITTQLLRRDQIEKIKGLYLILDIQASGNRNPLEITQQSIAGGARLIQLRAKNKEKGELLTIAKSLKDICYKSNILFIINDHIDLALACDADGVHLGQKDLLVAVARNMLPQSKILGFSTATLEEARQAEKDGADYVAVGSIYPTESKEGTRPAGLEILRQVKNQVSTPVVAIGGINIDNVADVMEAGADAIAVINAVLGADNVKEASQRLTDILEKETTK